jgi:ribonuclease HII
VVENFADKKYVVVAAASIIGKVLRDKVVERLKRRVSYDFGVGYSHDARSVKFVEKLLKERKHLPPYVRQTWNTVKELKKQVMRKSLKEFVEGR